MKKTINMKKSLNITIALVAAFSLVSCFNDNKPNYQFMPNMYEPVGYETYGEYDIFENEQEAKLPAEGSIPRGWTPYEYDNTTEGLNLAKAELKNPLDITEDNISEGEALYTIYCAVCHGDKGDGQGILAEREKFLGIPSYADPGRTITMGGTYHVQMYGLNAMGSYASQTNEKERWQIAMHVMDLKAALNGEASLLETAGAKAADSTNMESSTEEGDKMNTEDAANTSENETN
ncbi:MAG: cytochrome C [Flavobacteriaceae bacterium]|jgi:mono/diheme cytochrome c family protein|nr:cytochrome C [Flavobacteriaceae bacterium]|tara:strand:+ start:2937 stop:3638 length:702 start_codon:yes stop_codon:yes gene_type:complete